uniref:U2 small nuclear ribonucleoprotein auxiliary factor 35 kDa subunit-related protein 2-like n=1 Tax=Saccoglossus kowalevskii TaxID=10224 RepID=A0ABM0GXL8_SACKO
DVLKNLSANQNEKDDGPWCNPEPMIKADKPTEKCSFFIKTGACRFGDRCSRYHPPTSVSTTLVIPKMFSNFSMEQCMRDEYDTDICLEFDEKDAYADFLSFYDDVLGEFRALGEVIQFKVCCNWEPHLRGNVYVQYNSEDECSKAISMFNGRYYAGKQLTCLYCPITKWKSAICGLFAKKRCPKGKHCNFLHVFQNPGGEFTAADRDLLHYHQYDRHGDIEGNLHEHHARSSERDWYSSESRVQKTYRSRNMYKESSPSNGRHRRISRTRDHKYNESSHRGRARSHSRDRSHSRGRDSSYSRGRDRSHRDRSDRSRSHSRDRSHSRGKDRRHSRGRERGHRDRIDKGRSNSRGRDRSCSRDRSDRGRGHSRDGSDRGRSHSRGRDRRHSRGRDRSHSKGGDRNHSKGRGRSHSKGRGRSHSRDKDRSPSRDRSHSRGRDRSHSKGRGRSHSRDRGSKHSRGRDRSPSRDRSHSRGRDRNHSRERSKDRSHSKSRDRNKSSDRDHYKSRHRSRSRNRADRSHSRGRDRSHCKGRDSSTDRSHNTRVWSPSNSSGDVNCSRVEHERKERDINYKAVGDERQSQNLDETMCTFENEGNRDGEVKSNISKDNSIKKHKKKHKQHKHRHAKKRKMEGKEYDAGESN